MGGGVRSPIRDSNVHDGAGVGPPDARDRTERERAVRSGERARIVAFTARRLVTRERASVIARLSVLHGERTTCAVRRLEPLFVGPFWLRLRCGGGNRRPWARGHRISTGSVARGRRRRPPRF